MAARPGVCHASSPPSPCSRCGRNSLDGLQDKPSHFCAAARRTQAAAIVGARSEHVCASLCGPSVVVGFTKAPTSVAMPPCRPLRPQFVRCRAGLVVMWNRTDRALCASHMRGEAAAGARTEGISAGIPLSPCYTCVDALAHASAASCA